ncbi:MAG TPA: hypothetical protein VJN93_07165 [Candidatus Acidoferrum sp.]|nr:hypothetical protein [Candidatus Acidoferrum sp.]
MSTLHPIARKSLCSFTFADGRHCRTPRSSPGSALCAFHARKEAQSRASQNLGRDFDYFFSGEHLCASDLAAVIGRLFAAVARGDVKPKVAATLAYLAQTLLHTIQLSREEYISAFGNSQWRETLANSIGQNFSYGKSPAAPAAAPSAAPTPDSSAASSPTDAPPSSAASATTEALPPSQPSLESSSAQLVPVLAPASNTAPASTPPPAHPSSSPRSTAVHPPTASVSPARPSSPGSPTSPTPSGSPAHPTSSVSPISPCSSPRPK